MKRVTRRTLAAICLLSALLCATLAHPAQAQSVERIFSAGNEAYFRGDFSAAVKQY